MKNILRFARVYGNTYKYLFNLVRSYCNAYPYIKSVIIVIISIFVLVILVHICKEVGLIPAQKIFDFLNQWAMVLSAPVMLLLAGVAVWAILDNRHGRKVDRMQTLQNRIVSWAVDVRKALFVPWFDIKWVVQAHVREKLEAIVAVSSIVKANASELSSDGELANKVENAVTHLRQFINNLQHTRPEHFSILETPWNNLKQEFLDVIESTSSIEIPEFK